MQGEVSKALKTSSMAVAQANLLDVASFVMLEGHGVKGLSELGLKALPPQFIQPPEERLHANQVIAEEQIPIVDFANWEDPRVAEAIIDASERYGSFQVINHGVPLSVLEDAKAATRRFFNLPAEEKKKCLKENSPTNNVRLTSSFVPHKEKALKWKDFLSLFYVSDEEANAYWPAACRDEILEYMRVTETFVEKLMDILMTALNVKKIDESTKLTLMGSKRVNVIFYPKCPNPELTVGVGRHSDVSSLTLLLQDDIGGLYFHKIGTENWIPVPPLDGGLVINIGDALQIMSNGRYKSVEHRVIANGTKDRISVPLFFNPRPSDFIEPLLEVLERGQKPLYKKVLYKEYVTHFYRKPHDGKNTLDFAANN